LIVPNTLPVCVWMVVIVLSRRLGGHFQVLSQPGQGTLLAFTIPFAEHTPSVEKDCRGPG